MNTIECQTATGGELTTYATKDPGMPWYWCTDCTHTDAAEADALAHFLREHQ